MEQYLNGVPWGTAEDMAKRYPRIVDNTMRNSPLKRSYSAIEDIDNTIRTTSSYDNDISMEDASFEAPQQQYQSPQQQQHQSPPRISPLAAAYRPGTIGLQPGLYRRDLFGSPVIQQITQQQQHIAEQQQIQQQSPQQQYIVQQPQYIAHQPQCIAQQAQHIATQQSATAISAPNGRIIAVAAYTIYERTFSVLASIWAWLRRSRNPPTPTQVYAVETSPAGNKRRAIAADDMTDTTTGNMPQFPGHFPSPAMAITPPDSRPTSSGSSQQKQDPQQQKQDSMSPEHQQQHSPLTSTTDHAPTTPPAHVPALPTEAEQRRAAFNAMFPKLRDNMTLEDNLALIAQDIKDGEPAERAEQERVERQKARAIAKLSPASRAREKRIEEVAAQEEKKEMRIQSLINRANRAKILGRPQISFMKHVEARMAREEKIRVEARKKAEDIVWEEECDAALAELNAQEAAKEAEEARMKVEEEARAKAEEEKLKIEAAAKAEEELKAAELAEQARKLALETAPPALIRELDPAHIAKLDEMLAIKSDQHVVRISPEGVELSRRDFGTILSGKTATSPAHAWLNDEVVNAWFATIVSRKLEQNGYVKGPKNVPSHVTYNTAWVSTVKTKKMEGIRTWSRRKGIQGEKLLRCEKVFFPVNTGAHWLLLIISPKEKTIEYLDSLHMLRSGEEKKWFKMMRQWLEMELEKKYVADEWTESKTASSMQTNSDDCGAFTCFNGLAAATGVSFEEVTAGKMQMGRRVMAAVLSTGQFEGISTL
ncbi:hypothetical protein LTR10_000652 [Elasticomyces elasticus]|nr:hypothetical protein LTR10_000652 [Elasticomyces elasticus]KAK4980100.1 hypothetical protein LTR42_000407 [Elasticomyces elasticus]